MKELKFQQKAVRKLVDEVIDLLRLSGHRKTLIFKAPTGAGKTVMASQMLADLTEELKPYINVVEEITLDTFFDEDWFKEEKKLIYLPI